jgi:murein DD-endopeptidase MepM/ murein hydrolase activator NlpD
LSGYLPFLWPGNCGAFFVDEPIAIEFLRVGAPGILFRNHVSSPAPVIYQPQPHNSAKRSQAVRRAHVDFHHEHHWRERPLPTPLYRKLLRRAESLWFTARERLAGVAIGTWLKPVGIAAVLVAMVPLSAMMKSPEAKTLNMSLALPPAKFQPLNFAPTAEVSDAYMPGVNDDQWRLETVGRNETLGTIFERVGLSAADLHRVVNFSPETQTLTKIFPGQQLAFQVEGSELKGLQFDGDEAHRVLVTQKGDELSQRLLARQIETRVNYASATIDSSLFGAASDAEVSDASVLRMVEIFNFDIDFAQDLRDGDQFSLVYEQIYRDGEKLRDGEILAATFINRGKRYEIYRFVDDNGRVDYLNAQGLSRKKAFIRTPVEFTRISSKFSPHRKHPVLGTMRRHMGVDYAAPTGTPIKATGSATVKFIGWQNGYGNVIYLSHKGGIETVYGHLSRFAKGLSKGDRVSQSDVIGYVGSTGMSTGPHLHYEFRIQGAHRDPLSVDLPIADPLSGAELARFHKDTQPLIARMQNMELALAPTRKLQ